MSARLAGCLQGAMGIREYEFTDAIINLLPATEGGTPARIWAASAIPGVAIAHNVRSS